MNLRGCLLTFTLGMSTAATGCLTTTPLAHPGPHMGQKSHNLPPAAMLMHPGPGVDGPGPGVLMPPQGVMPVTSTSQIAFVGPDGMNIAWDVSAPGMFDSEPLVVPGRQNFTQAAIYRLKLTSIPGRAGVELYPTLEVGPATPRTDAYLAHNAIPIQFTEEDLDQVLSGNFVTKVIYLPDPEFQELALAGVETLVSTRLDPGVDPIVEADRRGAIMAVVRLGNKDLQAPGGAGPDQVVPANFEPMGPGPQGPMGGPMGGQMGPMGPMGGPMGMPSGAMTPPGYPPGYLSGVSVPQWGMPITGTPIGLPGPPHIPLGVPAGLQRHVVKNHTKMSIPGPTKNVQINVRQKPGFSYPKPVSRVHIEERMPAPPLHSRNPWWNKTEQVQPAPGEDCDY